MFVLQNYSHLCPAHGVSRAGLAFRSHVHTASGRVFAKFLLDSFAPKRLAPGYFDRCLRAYSRPRDPQLAARHTCRFERPVLTSRPRRPRVRLPLHCCRTSQKLTTDTTGAHQRQQPASTRSPSAQTSCPSSRSHRGACPRHLRPARASPARRPRQARTRTLRPCRVSRASWSSSRA